MVIAGMYFNLPFEPVEFQKINKRVD